MKTHESASRQAKLSRQWQLSPRKCGPNSALAYDVPLFICIQLDCQQMHKPRLQQPQAPPGNPCSGAAQCLQGKGNRCSSISFRKRLISRWPSCRQTFRWSICFRHQPLEVVERSRARAPVMAAKLNLDLSTDETDSRRGRRPAPHRPHTLVPEPSPET